MTEQTNEPTVEEVAQTAETTAELDEVATLKATISELEAQVKDAKEVAARANAESYNAQRRM